MIKSESELQQLIGSQESRTLDFKQTLNLNETKNKETLELLKDITSFANTVGGQIIYGIKEENLVATELVGIELTNPDETVQKIENKLKEMVQPRIPGIHILPVQLSNSNFAIVINIPKSWLGPHGFIFEKGWRFYLRSTTQSYPVTIDQLRDLFIQSDQLVHKIRNFRDKRISEILADAISLELNPNLKSKLIIHVIPTLAFSSMFSLDFSKIELIQNNLQPIYGGGSYRRFNFDGFLSYDFHWDNNGVSNYYQLFRNGIVETVDSRVMNTNYEGYENHIHLPTIEEGCREFIAKVFKLYQYLEIDSPIVIFFTMLNVEGKKCRVDSMRYRWFESKEIDREHLLFPEVVFNSVNDKIEDKAEECFIPFWHSFGSPNRLI